VWDEQEEEVVVTVVVVVVVFNSLRTRIIAACGEPHLLWEFRAQAPARLISIPAQHARPFVHTSESRPFHLPYPRQASYHHANQKTKSPPSEEYALHAFTLTLGSAHSFAPRRPTCCPLRSTTRIHAWMLGGH